jgi:hypothetical protein
MFLPRSPPRKQGLKQSRPPRLNAAISTVPNFANPPPVALRRAPPRVRNICERLLEKAENKLLLLIPNFPALRINAGRLPVKRNTLAVAR